MFTILNFFVQFDAPVVAAWYLLHDQMYSIDLFSGAQWTSAYDDHMGPLTPSLYIGMHNRQVSLLVHMRLVFAYTDSVHFVLNTAIGII
jgi:hypothetical protein